MRHRKERLLFEISEIDKPGIIFHLFSDRDCEEHPYEQIEGRDDLKTRRLAATISPKNASVSKNYSKCIADIIKEGDKNTP